MPITVSGTSITFNDATTQTTAFTGGGVTSLNGETGAITNTTLGNIGSVIWAANCTTGTIAGGATTAGSNLRYPSTVSSSQAVTSGQNYYSENPSVPYGISYTSWNAIGNIKQSEGNSGYTLPVGATALSGTWRAMGGTGSRSSAYSGDSNTTQSQNYVGLFVRVS
jgi:hypothetical protein